MNLQILCGDATETLRTLPERSAQCCVTSPPYYGLRDYGVDGQIGLEESPVVYVERLVSVFREVRRVLADDGTLWLNLGDSYARAGGEGGCGPNAKVGNTQSGEQRRMLAPPAGYKPKDLLGIPWMVAFALRADGWYLRSAVIWQKPNPMPESVRDRPTNSYEQVFLLTKTDRYFYDAGAIAEEFQTDPKERYEQRARITGRGAQGFAEARGNDRDKSGGFPAPRSGKRNARNVWTITPRPFKGAHFAVMPLALAERCIKAGSRIGETVLDPFGGAGTTGLAALTLGRRAVLVELNPSYVELNPSYVEIARERLRAVPTFAEDVFA